jgi:16S rRNA (uracil1498-N3)-methyltransferase
MPRFFCDLPLVPGDALDLPAAAARHVQVLRLQPGQAVTLFNGLGGEYLAEVTHMGRSDVQVRVISHAALEHENWRAVHLAIGMPANERMDWLVEKATELGVTRLTPLMTERSVLRLQGERAEKKRGHWQSVAAAACEQCGRNRLPEIDLPQSLTEWLSHFRAAEGTLTRMLSLSEGSQPLRSSVADASAPVLLVSGPEGGLSSAEEAMLRQHHFAPVTLGPRILRAETAALAALAALTL